MGYEIMKAFKIDRKNLTISGRYASSNTWNADGTRFTDDFVQNFENEEDFNQKLVTWANCFLSGIAQFSPSMTFAKRVNWLVQNGYAYDCREHKDSDWEWLQLDSTQEIIDVLSGKTKVKTPLYAMVSLSNRLVLKTTQNGIRLQYAYGETKKELAQAKGRKVSRLSKAQVESIQSMHKDFLEQYDVEVVAL